MNNAGNRRASHEGTAEGTAFATEGLMLESSIAVGCCFSLFLSFCLSVLCLLTLITHRPKECECVCMDICGNICAYAYVLGLNNMLT